MLPDSQPSVEAVAAPSKPRLLAPAWHTAVLVAVLLIGSVGGSRGHHPLASHKLSQYLWGMAWEWILVVVAWLGFRKRVKLRELIGGRWSRWEDFFLDVATAAFFWLIAMLVLACAANLMHLDQGGNIDTMRRQLDFLVPRTRFELAVWFCLSTTAGFCEEVLFRGYLQLQFAAMTNSMLLGAILSALVFGASHGYEGVSRMVLIGIFGLLFGLLAWWRKSLRPGMMAHAWHDALSGAVLRMLK